MTQDYAEAVQAARELEHCPLCGAVGVSAITILGGIRIIACSCVPQFTMVPVIPPEVWLHRDWMRSQAPSSGVPSPLLRTPP